MLKRRTLLGRGLAAIGLARGFGCRRDASPPQAASAPTTQAAVRRWLTVEKKVSIPLASVNAPWQPVRFRVICPLPEDAPGGMTRIALKGLLLRLPPDGPGAAEERLRAYCITCPHELCDINFVPNTRYVKMDRGRPPSHPLFVCPCHFSVYDPLADGAVISGPAPRGVFRFAIDVVEDRIEVSAVEKEVAYVT